MTNAYTKVFTLVGYYFTKDYDKKKLNKVKHRTVLEETVIKNFKKGDCEILIYFQESEKSILITKDSKRDEVLKYLGEKFAPEY
ncbi:MAG: hypothetical protein WBH44_10610 [Proteocatella sp.]